MIDICLKEFAVQNLDLYYDTDSQWPVVYGQDSNLTNCREKESVLQVEICPGQALIGPCYYITALSLVQSFIVMFMP